MYELTKEIRSEICKVILGKDDIIQKVLMAILSQGHVLLEDVPGVGKTTLALAFAKTLGLDSKRVQFTSDTLPSDIIGFSVYNREKNTLEYKTGAIMTNLLLADEINRTSSKTQSALLEAMAEGRVTVDGTTYRLPSPFIVLATQNPAGSAGTQLLPVSQLDRFLLCLHMGYPDRNSEIELMRERHHADPLTACRKLTDTKTLLQMIQTAQATHTDDRIYGYIASLLEATRKHPQLQLGVSPRGGLAVCRTAKAHAFLSGRDYVTPEDVSAVFRDVCAHRVLLSQKARMHEIPAEKVLTDILEQTKAPDRITIR